MELFRHELYKLFGRKIIWLCLLFFIILIGFSSLGQAAQFTHSYGDLRQYYSSMYKGREGKVDAALLKKWDDWAKQNSAAYERKYLEGKSTVSDNRQLNFYMDISLPRSLLAERAQQITKLQKQMKAPDASLDKNSYTARSDTLQLDMLKQLKAPGLYFTMPLGNSLIFPSGFGFCVMFVLILLGVSPVFTDEYTSNMDSLILSAKKGRKKVVTAKLASTALYCCFIGTIVPLANFCYQAASLGIEGWNAPLQQIFPGSPYALTFGEFLLIETLIGLIACVFFGMLVLFVSSLSKNVLIPFFVCGCLVVLTTLIKIIFSAVSPKALLLFADFSYSELLRACGLFETFKVFNLFGFPVPYLNLILPVYALVTAIVVYLIYRLFPKHQVG
jgi:hypothetical protein